MGDQSKCLLPCIHQSLRQIFEEILMQAEILGKIVNTKQNMFEKPLTVPISFSYISLNKLLLCFLKKTRDKILVLSNIWKTLCAIWAYICRGAHSFKTVFLPIQTKSCERDRYLKQSFICNLSYFYKVKLGS